MKNLILSLTFLILILIAFDTNAQTTLVTQGFNGTTNPSSWATTVVNDPGTDPTITYVTSSTNPTVSAPDEGTRFVNFNSYYCANLAEIRLQQSTSFSTINYYTITVNFAWYESPSGGVYTGEGVTLQWSTDGTTWTNAAFYQRNTPTAGWKDKTFVLPSGAASQETLYIAFLFNSEYGYNCHIDDVVVTGLPAQTNELTFSGSGASTTVDSIRVDNLTQCTSTVLNGGDILVLDGIVGINNIASGSNSRLLIYPNPVTENCFVEFESKVSGLVSLVISDITGKVIIKTRNNLSQGYHRYQVKGLGSGAYAVQVYSDAFSYTGKIISNRRMPGTADITYETLNTKSEKQSNTDIWNTKKQHDVKGTSSIIHMQYNMGDLLKFTGFSGVHSTVRTLIPTANQNINFTFVSCIDGDNNSYPVVQIGSQTWMAENLKTTKYCTGGSINFVPDQNSWSYLTIAAYCDPKNIPANADTFGQLYNWWAASSSSGICPTGWHVPSNTEWHTLVLTLDPSAQLATIESTTAGELMREACSPYWDNLFSEATNSSGFTAIPSGGRDSGGGWSYYLNSCYMWSSTEYSGDCTNGWGRSLGGSIHREYYNKECGFTVRCIKN